MPPVSGIGHSCSRFFLDFINLVSISLTIDFCHPLLCGTTCYSCVTSIDYILCLQLCYWTSPSYCPDYYESEVKNLLNFCPHRASALLFLFPQRLSFHYFTIVFSLKGCCPHLLCLWVISYYVFVLEILILSRRTAMKVYMYNSKDVINIIFSMSELLFVLIWPLWGRGTVQAFKSYQSDDGGSLHWFPPYRAIDFNTYLNTYFWTY